MKKILSALAILVLMVSSTAFASGIGKILNNPVFQAVDSSGIPLAGGLLYSYTPGTTTAKATYSDKECTVANTNPVVLDSNGQAIVYLLGATKLNLTASDGTQQINYPIDYVRGFDETFRDYYYPDYNATDQGVTGDSNTLKYCIDTISTDTGTILLRHNSGSATTTYTLSTSETIPSNVSLKIEPGAIITVATGVTLTINGPVIAGPIKIFNCAGTGAVSGLQNPAPEWWATNTVPGTTDMTTAIQAAINNAKALGGGIVRLLPKKYLVSNIILYDGVRLLGSGDSYGEGGDGTGTVLYSETGSPVITVNGATGYGFEIAYLHILGDDTALQDGIYLAATGGSVPRTANIHDLSIVGVGRDAVRLDGFSYLKLSNLNIYGPGQHGINIIEDNTYVLREFLYINNVSLNAVTSNGINIENQCSNVYFNGIDLADCAKGVYIEGENIFDIYFTNTNIIRPTTYAIELFANNYYMTRIGFTTLGIALTGSSADERGIYQHRTGSYTVERCFFHDVEVSKIGATAPTYSIEADTLVYSEITGFHPVSVGAVSLNAYSTISYKQKDLPIASAALTGLTYKDFTVSQNPSTIKVCIVNMSTNGTSVPIIQLGTASGIVTSGYTGSKFDGNTTYGSLSSGFVFAETTWGATLVTGGVITLERVGVSNIWACSYNIGTTVSGAIVFVSGHVDLSGEITTVRLTMTNGTDAFDAGTASIK